MGWGRRGVDKGGVSKTGRGGASMMGRCGVSRVAWAGGLRGKCAGAERSERRADLRHDGHRVLGVIALHTGPPARKEGASARDQRQI